LTGGVAVDHFVLLLQEAHRGGAAVPPHSASHRGAARIHDGPDTGPRHDIVEVASALGLSLFYVPSMRNGLNDGGAPEDRGNAILSTLPLSELQAIELPFERQRRVAIAATIDGAGPDGKIRVVSTHLDASASARRLWVFTSGLRERQAARLIASLPHSPAAVMGSDLNTWVDGRREPAVRLLQQVFPSTPPIADRATVALGFTLDYLFFRLPDGWSAASNRVADRYGSDHHPIVGWIDRSTVIGH
jgi:endonuclease/exonuclease/phosphatase family metal-dependent hydrolase